MLRYSAIILLLFLSACDTNVHPSIYVYKSQVYTSNEVAEFEVDHYKTFGNSNFLVIDDENSAKDLERKQAIDELCQEYQVTCSKLDMSQKNDQTLFDIVKAYQKYGDQKFFVFSPSRETTARFAGTVNRLLHRGNEKSIDVILKSNGIEDAQPLKDYLMGLKKLEGIKKQ